MNKQSIINELFNVKRNDIILKIFPVCNFNKYVHNKFQLG